MRHVSQYGTARRALGLAAVSTLLCTGAALPARGPAPSVAAVDDCAGGGVDVTAGNAGDAPFRFRLAGVAVTVEPGGARTITVPVGPGQSYRFTVLGPDGFREDVAGVLRCGAPTPSATPAGDPAANAGTAAATVPPAGAGTAAATPRAVAVATGAGERRQVIAGVTDLDGLIMGAVLVLLGSMVFVIRRLTLP
ncbi:phospholipase domain-containing protein [Streptomyces sp. NPDC048361]|uniref:phospholipase domain-containing protein n=1 Tax=Streptomyces sp. NPDC048361 TaxID=3154720 RepID=UPI003441BE0A